jgi:glucosamine-6-phosphate deaminase
MLDIMPGASPLRFDGATVFLHADVETMAAAAATQAAAIIRAAVRARGVAHVMFATGNSQLAFTDALVTGTPDVPWSDIVVFHMDEYAGVGPDHPAGFQRWIRERIVERTSPRAAHYVDGTGDPEAECLRYVALLRRHPLDLCCLGIGENGHLAFNDPPVADFADPLDVKVVELDPACRRQQVDEGHFPDLGSVPPRASGPSTTPPSTWSRPRPPCWPGPHSGPGAHCGRTASSSARKIGEREWSMKRRSSATRASPAAAPPGVDPAAIRASTLSTHSSATPS